MTEYVLEGFRITNNYNIGDIYLNSLQYHYSSSNYIHIFIDYMIFSQVINTP